ncbi:MAG: crotonase/enoyl-CoA hydratase family protein [Acidimicrobiales bacterium]
MTEDHDQDHGALADIAVETADNIMTITLDRPDRLNAFTERMKHELIAAFDRADADDDVRAVIVTGRGRGFCAGADLGLGADTFNYRSRRADAGPPEGLVRDGGGMVALRIFACHKPVIAAINGPAVGVGITMTLPMDIRLAAESARIGFVFARRGLVPEACSSWFLPRLVGISQAAEWVYTGRVFPATEALQGGLVSRVVPDSDLMPAARTLAGEIATNTSPTSVALSRQMMWRMLGAPHPMDAHRVDSRGIASMGASPDAAEGVMSFLEKRPARFSMSPSADLPDIFPDWSEPEFG